MSYATCTKCGLVYNWHARRGSSLKDNPSPCCSAPGKAVGTHKAPPKVNGALIAEKLACGVVRRCWTLNFICSGRLKEQRVRLFTVRGAGNGF